MVFVMVCCFIRRSNKKVERSMYQEYSEQEPFVETLRTGDIEAGQQPEDYKQQEQCAANESDLLTHEATVTSMVAFDLDDDGDGDDGCTGNVKSPFTRIKSHTITGCSPRMLARVNNKRKSNSLSEDCNQNDLPQEQLDKIMREGSIFDSFSKLKHIYDHQSSKYINNDANDGHLPDKNNGVGHLLPTTSVYANDYGFDRVKMLYDRCKENIQQHSLDSIPKRCEQNDELPT